MVSGRTSPSLLFNKTRLSKLIAGLQKRDLYMTKAIIKTNEFSYILSLDFPNPHRQQMRYNGCFYNNLGMLTLFLLHSVP